MDARNLATQLAISDFNAGLYSSLRVAAKAYGIPSSTLYDRLRGVTDSATSYTYQ
jgi:hypothetical protein